MERINLVTFVCRGNINRSPAAQYIAENMARVRGLGVEFTSAGLIEPPYSALSSEMAWALRELGYQPPVHVPRKVTAELLQNSSLVLCFERRQVEQIRTLRGGIGGNVYTLPEYAGFPEQEIADPHGLIRATLASRVIKSFPPLLRLPLYDRIGHVHPTDEWGVLKVHIRLAKEIERYVGLAIEKITVTPLAIYNMGDDGFKV